jgi:hypothetical protein
MYVRICTCYFVIPYADFRIDHFSYLPSYSASQGAVFGAFCRIALDKESLLVILKYRKKVFNNDNFYCIHQHMTSRYEVLKNAKCVRTSLYCLFVCQSVRPFVYIFLVTLSVYLSVCRCQTMSHCMVTLYFFFRR